MATQSSQIYSWTGPWKAGSKGDTMTITVPKNNEIEFLGISIFFTVLPNLEPKETKLAEKTCFEIECSNGIFPKQEVWVNNPGDLEWTHTYLNWTSSAFTITIKPKTDVSVGSIYASVGPIEGTE